MAGFQNEASAFAEMSNCIQNRDLALALSQGRSLMSTNKGERNGSLTLADYSTWYVDKAIGMKEINRSHLSTHQKREFPAQFEGILRTAVWKGEIFPTLLFSHSLACSLVKCV